MEKLVPRAQEGIRAGEEAQQDASFAARRAVMFATAMAVFGVVGGAQAQQGGGRPAPAKKPIADASVFLSCPDKEPARLDDDVVTAADECRDARLEVHCANPIVAAAWDIPSTPLEDQPGVSMPVRLLRGGSIFVRCEGDPLSGGRIIDVLPPTRATSLQKADSVQVREHPEVRAAELAYAKARQRLLETETEMVRTGRSLLAARRDLTEANQQVAVRKTPQRVARAKAAESTYMSALEDRQKVKAAYEAAQVEFDRSVELFSAAVQRVLAGLKAEALRERPARKTSSPTAVSGKPAHSVHPSHRGFALSGGASGSLLSTPDHIVGSPGFFLEGDMRGLLPGRPAVGIQVGARYMPLAQRLSGGDPHFAPLDPDRRLPGFLATLDARVQRDFPLGRFGSADIILRPSAGLGVGVLRFGRGVDAGISRKNRRDLADVPPLTRILPMTVAGARVVLTRGRISAALGLDGMLSAILTQGRGGAPDDRRNLIGDIAATASVGYEF